MAGRAAGTSGSPWRMGSFSEATMQPLTTAAPQGPPAARFRAAAMRSEAGARQAQEDGIVRARMKVRGRVWLLGVLGGLTCLTAVAADSKAGHAASKPIAAYPKGHYTS